MDSAQASKIRVFMEEKIPFQTHLGVQVTELKEGFARMELDFQDHFLGNTKLPALHGGVVASLIDGCAGAASFTLFDERSRGSSTVDLRVDYLRPARKEALVAEAKLVRNNGRTAVFEVTVFHRGNAAKPVATGMALYSMHTTEG